MNIEALKKMASSSEKKAGDLGQIIADTLAMPGGAIAARREQILNEMADDEKASPRAHAISEMLGPATSTIAANAVGGLVGGMLNGEEGMAQGTAVASGISGVAQLAAMIAAAVKRRRTAGEQIKNDKRSVLRDLFLPGVSTYNLLKRQGRAFAENKDRIAERIERNKSKKTEKKAAFDVDWSKIKGNVNWDAIKQKLTEAKQWYEGQNPETRALIGAGVGLGGGALLGKLMGRTGTGAVAGAVAGAGAGAYWKELKKVIEATKPIASDAAKKTKDRVSQLMQKVRPKSTQGEKAPSGERDAIEKAVSASLGGYADRFMKDWERTQAEGLPPQGVNIVVR